MSYDIDNIFAKILRGEMPCHKVYDDDVTFAFLDIMPRSDGHTLVIPKTAARNILDAAPEDLATTMATVQKISQVAIKAFDADGITLQQFNEPASGQVVFHLHFHILPRWDGVKLNPPGQMGDNDVLTANAKKLRQALGA